MPRPWWLLLLGACTPDFPNPTTVQDLRVLDVSADKPELVLDVGPLADLDHVPDVADAAALAPLLAQAQALLPASFPPVTLRALVIDPHGGGRAVHFRVVTCVNLADGSSVGGTGAGMGMVSGRIRDTIDRDPCPDDAPLLGESDVGPGPEGVVPYSIPFLAT